MKNKVVPKIILSCILLVFVQLLLNKNVFAATFDSLSLSEQTKSVIVAQNMIQCLATNGVKKTVNYNDSNKEYGWVVNSKDNNIGHPVGYLVSKKDGYASCGELFGTIKGGDGNNVNGWSYFGLDKLSEDVILKNVFGYRQSTSQEDKTNVYTISVTGTEDSPIWYIDNKGEKRFNGTITTTIKLPYSDSVGASDCGGFCMADKYNLIIDNDGYIMDKTLNELYKENPNSINDEITKRFEFYLKASLRGIGLGGYNITETDSGERLVIDSYLYSDIGSYNNSINVESKGVEIESGEYYGDARTAVDSFRKYLEDNYFGTKLSNGSDYFEGFPEQRYYNYLNALHSSEICNADFVEVEEPETRIRFSTSQNSFFEKIKIVGDSGELVDVYADWSTGVEPFNNNAKIDSNIPIGFSTSDCREIAKMLSMISGNLDAKARKGVAGVPVGGGTNKDSGGGSGGSNSKDEKLCANQGGVKSLGWIVCPILEWLADTSKDVYDDYVEPGLQIEPELFGGGNGDILEGWRTFQGFANTLFIILFLVVIFSQLTGYGIDNYGIKKILPKLIVTAILINLSFIICQIAVDLSNILGNSLQTLFDNLGQKGTISFVINDAKLGSSNSISVDLSGKLASVLALSGIVTGLAALWANPAIIISLLVSALSVFVSIFFLFIILAARKAAIAVLMVISPLAFACLVLPNTKKLFDKWLKAGQALLLVYPICGLLVGGGNYVSRLLLSSETTQESFFLSFTAMIVGIVPIFFIPSVLKGSFAAMGNLGAKISGIGSKVKGGADKAIRGSDRYKNAQQRGLNRRNERSLRRRSGGRIGRDGHFHERGVRSRLSHTRLGRLLGTDVAVGKAREEYVRSQNARFDAANKIQNGVIDAALQEGENARVKEREKGRVGVVALDSRIVRRELENQRIQNEVEQDVNVSLKPLLNRDNVRTRMQNAVSEAIADNDVSVLRINDDLARQRKRAAVDAQELRSYTDQHANLTRTDMGNELTHAISAYSSDRSHANMIRLKAALSSSEGRGMNKEMLQSLSGLDLSAGNNQDAEILGQLANSSDRVLGQYGRQMSKPENSTESLSLSAFANSTGSVKLSEALTNIGTNALNGVNDDTLEYIKSNGSAVTGDMLINAASSTSNAKELKQINEMLGSMDPGKIKFSGSNLSKLDPTTIEAFRGKITSDLGLKNRFIQATEGIKTSPELLNGLNPDTRAKINQIRMGLGLPAI